MANFIEARPGISLEKHLEYCKTVSRDTDNLTTTSFNGVKLVVGPSSDIRTIVELYSLSFRK